MFLSIENLTKSFKKGEQLALDNINLEVQKGELLALVGASGSGKTTLLRLIAGFEVPNNGKICLNYNTVVSNNMFLPPEKRAVGMVFQSYALFPHLTVKENIQFGLHKYSGNRQKRVQEVMELVGIQTLGDRFPHQLSGGQQQRTALARAMAPEPELILLDEPFSNLDGILKEQLREEIRNLLKKAGITAILVTHDTQDALSTADRIAILKSGQIQQLDAPERIYTYPKNTYVASFFGRINIIRATAIKDGFESQIGFIESSLANDYEDKVTLAIRPESILISKDKTNLNGKIIKQTYLGDYYMVSIFINKDQTLSVKIPNVAYDFRKGQEVYFFIRPDKIQVMDTCWFPQKIKKSIAK